MTSSSSRIQRLQDNIQQEIAMVLRTSAHDPRFAQVTVTRVVLSKDGLHAKIYISLLSESERAATLKALKHAAGYLRHCLASSAHLRVTPSLRFYFDSSLQHSQRIAELLQEEDRFLTKEND